MELVKTTFSGVGIDIVTEGEQIVTMSAMKMETAIPAPRSGVVERVTVNAGDKVCIALCTARAAPRRHARAVVVVQRAVATPLRRLSLIGLSQTGEPKKGL